MKTKTLITSLLFLLFLAPQVMAEGVVVNQNGGSDIYGSVQPPASVTPPPPVPSPQMSISSSNSGGNNYSGSVGGPFSGGGNNYTNQSTQGNTGFNQYSGSAAGLLSPATTALLTPVSSDLSMKYLGAIFGAVDGVLPGGGSQILGKMFSVFNSVVLALGGIVLMYIVIISTVSTAHEGEVMGKDWSSIWIPIRSALGVGFLVPKASGYSLIQIMMMWIVTQGIGAADSIWNATLDYIGSGGVIVNTKGAVPPNQQAVTGTANSVLSSLTCLYGLQQSLNTIRQQINPPLPPVPPLLGSLIITPATGTLNIPSNANNYLGVYGPFAGACGKITWDASNPTSDAAFSAGILHMITNLASTAQQIATSAITTGKPLTPTAGPIASAVMDYTTLTLPLMNQVSAAAFSQGVPAMKQNGWILAGSYYIALTRANAEQLKAVTPPNVTGTDWVTMAGALQRGNGNWFSNSSGYTQQMLQANTAAYTYTITAGPLVSAFLAQSNPTTTPPPQLPPIQGLATTLLGLNTLAAASGSMAREINAITAPLDSAISSWLISPINSLLSQIVTSPDPMALLATFSNILLSVSFSVWGAATTFTIGVAIAATVVSYFFPAIGTTIELATFWMIPVLGSLLGIGMVAGIMGAFYVPLIPFILFTFGAIGWFVGVIETIIAAPLVALGLVSPEGDKAFGKAGHSIMLITNVFLRPTLMLFGLIAGIIMSYVGIWLLTQGYLYAALSVFSSALGGGGQLSAIGALIGGSAPIALASPITGVIALGTGAGLAVATIIVPLVTFAVIYIILATLIVQKAFELINIVPDSVLRWIGGTDKGPGAHMAEGMGQAAEQKISSGAEKGTAPMGETIKGKMKDEFKAKESKGSLEGGKNEIQS